MISLTYADPDTGNDVVWDVPFSEHSPVLEKRTVAIADAGDYLDPDVHYKGGPKLATLTSRPIPAAQIVNFNALREATKKGQAIEVGASVVPLVSYDYVAIREGDLNAKSLHGGRYFSFTLKLRVLNSI